MKPVLRAVIVLCLCFCVLPANAQQKFNVPMYSIEGAEKFVRFYEWSEVAGVKQWVKIIDNAPPGTEKPRSEKPVLEKHVYHVDRNKDGKLDLMHVENLFPEKFFSKSDPAYRTIVLSIDDNFDCVPERWLVDGGKEFGPANGTFDTETILADHPSHVREREYWKEYCK